MFVVFSALIEKLSRKKRIIYQSNDAVVKRNQSGSAQRKPQTLSTIVRYEILAHFELIANNICDNFFFIFSFWNQYCQKIGLIFKSRLPFEIILMIRLWQMIKRGSIKRVVVHSMSNFLGEIVAEKKMTSAHYEKCQTYNQSNIFAVSPNLHVFSV